MALLLDDRQSHSPIPLGLNLAGVVVIAYWTVRSGLASHQAVPVWAWWAAGASVVAWLVFSVSVRLPRAWSDSRLGRGAPLVCGGVMVVAGSAAAPAFGGLTITPVIVAIATVTAGLATPIGWGLAYAAAAVVLASVAAVPVDLPIWGTLGLWAGIAVGVLLGISRRQYRANEAQARLLGERELTMRQEHARLQLLADRQAAARDIHDVLAHSLGGLVIQLDAVEALLEAGDVASARDRAADARALAASGLDDARRAVAALREEPEGAQDPRLVSGDSAAPAQQLADALDELVAAHRSLGGTVGLRTTGEPWPVGAPLATALRRAVQESLSNARKHAPGQRVAIELRWGDRHVDLSVANRMPAGEGRPAETALAATGGGRGLTGMAERFRALPGGSAVTAIEGGEFVVRAGADRPWLGEPQAGDAEVGDPDAGGPEVGGPEVGDPDAGDPDIGDARAGDLG